MTAPQSVSADPTPILVRLDEAREIVLMLAAIGATPAHVETYSGEHPTAASHIDVDLRVSIYKDGEECERIAAALLDDHPDARIERLGGGTFAVICPGRPSWCVYFSASVCVKVQTGTVTRTIPDPVALEAVPLIEVEEPVYEWRCADPLAAMAVTS